MRLSHIQTLGRAAEAVRFCNGGEISQPFQLDFFQDWFGVGTMNRTYNVHGHPTASPHKQRVSERDRLDKPGQAECTGWQNRTIDGGPSACKSSIKVHCIQFDGLN